MRLIDADVLREKAFVDIESGESFVGLQEIDEMPTIEAVPVVYGQWMLESNIPGQWGGYTRKCSICGDYYTTEAESLYFCPRCGAKMNGIEYPDQYGSKFDFVDGKWQVVRGLIRERRVEPHGKIPAVDTERGLSNETD